jgi:predicted transcriptional regulator with HTH domain
LGNTIDGNIFNKHNDQEKKTLVKRIFFYLHGIYSIQTSLF